MKAEIVKKVAEISGVSEEICTKVISAFEGVMSHKFDHQDEGGGIMETITNALSSFLGKGDGK